MYFYNPLNLLKTDLLLLVLIAFFNFPVHRVVKTVRQDQLMNCQQVIFTCHMI